MCETHKKMCAELLAKINKSGGESNIDINVYRYHCKERKWRPGRWDGDTWIPGKVIDVM